MGMFEYSNLPPGLSQDIIEKDLRTKGFFQMPHFPGGHSKDDEANRLITKIGHLDNDIIQIKCTYNPRRLTYDFHVYFKNYLPLVFYVARESMIMNAETLQQITELILTHKKPPQDPEWICENENEQAMLDAAMDYGYV